MKILVAGGAGFIGSHLTDRLLAEGHNIVCVDKLVFGDKNIQHFLSDTELMASGRYKCVQTEIATPKNVYKLFAENQIDAIYHMAANSDIQRGGREPAIDFNDTLLTTYAILEGMRKYNVKNLFFASTSAVYGEMLDVELTETTGGNKPLSYYGGTKLASEALISSYVSMCDLNAVIFRFPNVIGPRLTHGVIFDFIEQLKINSTKLRILGNGTQCKPYIYVLDLIEAIIQLTKNWKPGAEIFNLSVKSEGTSVTKIAEIVIDVLGLHNVKFDYTGGDRGWKGDVPRFKYNISKILSTGWEPKRTSDEAVKQTVIDAISAMK